jgi:hypothetical protein
MRCERLVDDADRRAIGVGPFGFREVAAASK